MISAQLEISTGEAFARLRAYAYRHGRSLDEISAGSPTRTGGHQNPAIPRSTRDEHGTDDARAGSGFGIRGHGRHHGRRLRRRGPLAPVGPLLRRPASGGGGRCAAHRRAR
ncbi:hypothetical protein [Gandjariella thermophila]|uniref:hypothetical protein n=1 Tax=Gandjariella thermophila TaxID=1931992 RepID=UPI003530CEB0